jgi:hypothetical protein
MTRYLVTGVVGAVVLTAAVGCGRAKTDQAQVPENPLPPISKTDKQAVGADSASAQPLPLATDKN